MADIPLSESQQRIIAGHFTKAPLKDGQPLLDKHASWTTGSGGLDPLVFTASYDLTGFANTKGHSFLPHFEYTVGAAYHAAVPHRAVKEVRWDRADMRVLLPGKGELFLEQVDNLFALRNLLLQGRLGDIAQPPGIVRTEDIKTCFYFRASSISIGQLVGQMPIEHPQAEEVIASFLQTVDRRFAEYATPGQPRSDASSAYGALFADLEAVLGKADVQLKKAYF